MFGLNALQKNFINRDTLVAAFTEWVTDKSRDLGRILLDRSTVDAETHALVEALASKHLKLHGGDIEESLAALSALSSVRTDLERVADPELQTCLTCIPRTDERADPDATGPHARAAGSSTAAGVRFRILRLHRTGGLGAVYVARDEELHREVALKEIRDRHAHDPDRRSRFLLEAEITGGLEHPGVVPIYGLGTYADGRPFYAMRFSQGGQSSRRPPTASTKRTYLSREQRGPRPLAALAPRLAAPVSPTSATHDRLRAQPGHRASGHQARHPASRALRRDAGSRLGPGQAPLGVAPTSAARSPAS